MAEIKYVVKEARTVVSKPDNPDDFDRVPCWTVTRVTDGMGWHIGQYKTEQDAQSAANALTVLIPEEIG